MAQLQQALEEFSSGMLPDMPALSELLLEWKQLTLEMVLMEWAYNRTTGAAIYRLTRLCHQQVDSVEIHLDSSPRILRWILGVTSPWYWVVIS
jgi:hypothetical protein